MPFVMTAFGVVSMDNIKAPLLSTYDVHLFVNDLTPTWETILSDYQESAVAGYAPQGWDFPSPAVDNLDGTATLVGSVLVWTPSDTLLTEQIYGVFVTDPAAGGALFGGGRFLDAPIQWGDTLIPFVYRPRWKEGSLA